ncbi:ribose-phosphate diphosphokinase [Erythrobacter ani]|uniref:Ribose-phosphate diphosphokinase n=1 Tax=Erythrobacter ani TaxID=2827235 RepID=A0ABS6SKK0_9SPHN|nr:ribose-phosphate diphosphokinase [Erythrobacter ani]MBV7265497.1 ribose-phosphate diphosphokinase [Erythrobacter ani]
MKPLLFSLHAADGLRQSILANAALEEGVITHRRFPDGESYVRLDTPVSDRDVVLLCSLDNPDVRLMTLLLAADAARQQGARQVGLIAPYLAYMRQDQAFSDGEAVSAKSFASILSRHFDWLVTLEPHLHRIANLADLFCIPARAAPASGPIAKWIEAHVVSPYLIGPDSESAPWIKRIATRIGAPFAVFEKQRLGDREVRISGSVEGLLPEMTPVIVDDIVSSGGTMAKVIERAARDAGKPAIYIAVHVLAKQPPNSVRNSRAFARLISCNSVAHPSNAIDIAAPLLAEAQELIARASARKVP